MVIEIKKTSKEDIAYYASLNYISIGIRLLVSFFRRIIFSIYLGISGFGLIKMVELTQKYSLYSNLGMHLFLNRQTPILLGKNQISRTEIICSVVLFWTFVNAFLFTVIIWIAYKNDIFFNSNDFPFNIFVMITLLIIISRLLSFCKSISKAHGRFDLIGKLDVISAIISPLIILPLVIFFNFAGFILGTLCTHVIQFCYYLYHLYKSNVLPSRLYFSIKEFKSYLPLSMQLWAVSSLYSLNLIITPTLIAIFFPINDLGIFAFALSIFTLANSIANPIATGISRKMLFESSKNSLTKYRNYLVQTSILLFISLSLAYSLIFFLFKFLIENYITDFLPAIELMKVLLIANFLYVSIKVPDIFLNVSEMQKERIILFSIAGFINLLISIFLIKNGYDALALSYSLVLSLFVLSSAIFYLAFRKVSPNESITFVLKYSVFVISFYYLIKIITNLSLGTIIIEFSHLSELNQSLFLFLFRILVQIICLIILFQVIFYKENPTKLIHSSLITLKNSLLPKNLEYDNNN